eukprot:4913338-Prymnesium_polylepis.1
MWCGEWWCGEFPNFPKQPVTLVLTFVVLCSVWCVGVEAGEGRMGVERRATVGLKPLRTPIRLESGCCFNSGCDEVTATCKHDDSDFQCDHDARTDGLRSM